jgi:ABC-type nitrate/sulfonate/bicarbonate transport system substrate-binding protein
MAIDSLRIIYRSNSHASLWIVAEKSGTWAKHGLAVDSSPQLVRGKAVEALKNRHVDIISGNHHNLYVRNAKHGADFVHLALWKTHYLRELEDSGYIDRLYE